MANSYHVHSLLTIRPNILCIHRLRHAEHQIHGYDKLKKQILNNLLEDCISSREQNLVVGKQQSRLKPQLKNNEGKQERYSYYSEVNYDLRY